MRRGTYRCWRTWINFVKAKRPPTHVTDASAVKNGIIATESHFKTNIGATTNESQKLSGHQGFAHNPLQQWAVFRNTAAFLVKGVRRIVPQYFPHKVRRNIMLHSNDDTKNCNALASNCVNGKVYNVTEAQTLPITPIDQIADANLGDAVDASHTGLDSSSEEKQQVASPVEQNADADSVDVTDDSCTAVNSDSGGEKAEPSPTQTLSAATMVSIGKEYGTKNLCTLPADGAKKYTTVRKWKEYQNRMPTDAEWHTWSNKVDVTALCILTGMISGFLFVIDFDDGGSCFEAWLQLIPQELRDKITLIVRTPSGGYHVYLRCEGEPIGNVKLAWKKDGKTKDGKPKFATLIETRGEGGLVMAPPTLGYEIISGSLDNVPVVSREDVDKLFEVARSFCEKQTDNEPASTKPSSPSSRKQNAKKERPTPAQSKNNNFDRFVSSGEWLNHLCDLEALGWFFFESNGVLYFQTPDGDHSPGKHDGNIKDGIAYFFSKAPSPFAENKGYPIYKLFAGALFGDIGKTGLAKLAKKFFREPATSVPLPPLVSCGVAPLDSILVKIPLVNWEPFETVGRNGEIKPPSDRDYILRTCEQILRTADKAVIPLVNHKGVIYYSTGTHYKLVNELELKNFLIEGAIRCDVPSDVAVYQFFVEKIFKQFLINSARHNSGVSESDVPFINLQNGTLFFDKQGHRFETHSPKRFIRYCLHFPYDPAAIAKLWLEHINRSLPNPEKQQYLAKCLALPFYRGKIEKAPTFQGERDTGKSTTLDVFKALVGAENFTTLSLAVLTKAETQGDYARARLDGKLVNIASDISAKMNDEGLAKMLISREEVPARHPYGEGFDMRNYARLIFALNSIPPQLFTDPALTKRAAIIEFDQQIRTEDVVTGFAESIIENELPGVLNWIIENGLDQLLKTGRLDTPQCCVEAMERLRIEIDPLSGWLSEQGYYPGNAESISVKYAYSEFVDYCKDNGYQVLSKKTFTQRLRSFGYSVHAPNNHVGVKLFYTTSVPNNASPHSPDSPPQENRGETGVQEGNDKTPCLTSFPDHSPVIPPLDPTNTGMGNDGNEGNGFTEQSLAGQEGCNDPLYDNDYAPDSKNNPLPEYGSNAAKFGHDAHRRRYIPNNYDTEGWQC